MSARRQVSPSPSPTLGLASLAELQRPPGEGTALTRLQDHRNQGNKLQGAQQIHEVMCMGGLCSCMGFPPCHNQNYAMCQEILKEGGIHSPELILQQSKFLPGENSHFGVWLQKDWKLSACCTTLYLRKIWERYKNLLSADV